MSGDFYEKKDSFAPKQDQAQVFAVSVHTEL